MKIRLLAMLCASALSASALAQNATNRQHNAVPSVKDGTSVTLPPIEGCTVIPDDAYNGTQASMVCKTVAAPNVPGASITDANVQVSVAHTWVGDLVMKVIPPGGGAAVTLTSRPGLAELADDGTNCCGNSRDLAQANPISFDDQGGFPSGETLGTPATNPVPASSYTPNNGAALAGSLSNFNGLPANGGNFTVCVGDAGLTDVGNFCAATMTFTTGVLGDLSITKNAPSGVTTSGVFPFSLTAANAGPAAHPGAVVTDVLPAGLIYVGSNCGATAVGQTVTWNVGALASGGSASCQLSVRQAAAGCATISNTATIVGTDLTISDPAGNNTSTFANGAVAPQFADPGFEAGSPNPSWAATSTNFGDPFCTVAGCGNGTGTGPQSGLWWAWFGGATGVLEVGSVQQSIVIPTGTASINFGYESFVCSATAGAADFVRLLVGGTEVWRRDASSPNCGVLGYQNQSVNVDAFATGVSRVVRFESTQTAAGGGSNFFIDNVTLAAVPAATCTPPIPTDLSATITDAPDPVSAGQNLTYTSSITNNGTNFAENMSLAVALPVGTSLVSATASNGGVCVGSTCTWTGFAAPGTTYTTTVTALVAANVVQGTVLTGSATASSLTPESTPANNTATTTTTVNAVADLVVALTASAAQALVNVPVTFTATSLNNGPSDAQNVSITVTLTPDFRFSSVVATGATCTTPQVGTTGAVVCTWAGATAPGGTRQMTVVAYSNVEGATLVNASTTSATTDPVANNNATSATVQIGYLVEEIPTVSRNALLLLGLMLALAGFVAVRRQS